jgi:hypothetical protein
MEEKIALRKARRAEADPPADETAPVSEDKQS